nr:MAG TPA: hypothetical protein [Caudoviricetes sp.]
MKIDTTSSALVLLRPTFSATFSAISLRAIVLDAIVFYVFVFYFVVNRIFTDSFNVSFGCEGVSCYNFSRIT